MEMEKPVSTSGSGGSSFLNTVFIDTSLDTHLALMVFDSDTVSDLKKKILYEHPLCFPNIGEININALKVKRRGHLYHLSESMFVKSAFDGMSKCWFLSVDASSTGEHRENLNSCKPDSGNVVACLGVAPNNSSADVVDLIPGGTSKGVSNINNASLPEDGNNCHAKQSSASQQFGFSNFTKENSEDLHMEVELTADSNSKVLLPAENEESRPKVQEKDVEGNKICEELPASIAASVSKEKRKIRKRNKGAIRDHDVRENVPLVVESDKDALGSDNVLPENSFQNGRGAVLNDVSSVEIRDKRSTSRKRRADKGTKVSRKNSEFESNKDKDVSASEQGYKLKENSSQSGPTAKKKHKAEKKDGNENSLIEKGGLISDFVKQGTHPDITASSDFGQKLERLLAADASGGKKKKKKQKSNPNEVGSEISAVKDVNVDTFQPIEAINHKYVGGEADPRFVSRKFSMGGAISEPCLIPSAEIQEVSKTSRVTHLEGDDYMADTNDGNMESKNEEHEPDVASVIKQRDSINEYAAHVDSHPTLVTQNDVGVLGYENQSGTLEDKIVEPKKSAKKIKKSKKTKDPVGGKEAVDATHDRRPTSDISPAVHPNSVIGDLLSDKVDQVGKTDVRADVVIRDVLDSLHECSNGPENEPDVATVTKLRDSVDQNAARVDSHPTLVTQNDNGVSGYENQSGTLEDKIVEPKKSAKKIKKSKKTKDPVGGKEAVDATHDISPAVHPTSVSSDLLSDKVDQDGKTDVRADVVIQDVPDPLHECNNGPENVDKKSRQKTKRKISSVVDTPELKGKDDADLQDPTAQADNMSEVSASSKSRRKTAKVNLHAAAQLNGSDFGSKNNMGVGISSIHTQLDSSVNTSKSSHEVRPIQDVVNVNHPKNILVDDADNSIEVSCESERIKSQHENKIVDSGEMHIVKATSKKGVETEVKEKKKKKKPDVQSGGSRTVLPSSQILNGNSRKEAKAQAAKSSSIQSQRSSSKVEPHGSNVQSRQTLLTISGSAANEPLQTNKSEKNYSIPKEGPRPIDISSSRVHTHVEKNSAHAKRSTSERSNQTTSLNKGGNKNQSRLDIAKATGNNNVKVVNSLANTKSLLATAGTIFKHDDKESSDEDGVENSDSSTRTPSGSLSTSNYSDHSDANVGSSRNGSYNEEEEEEEEGGGRNRKKPGPSSPKSMSFQAFLRNSSNYKKAKLTASQSQDLDSQPDEFVPDSQAI